MLFVLTMSCLAPDFGLSWSPTFSNKKALRPVDYSFGLDYYTRSLISNLDESII